MIIQRRSEKLVNRSLNKIRMQFSNDTHHKNIHVYTALKSGFMCFFSRFLSFSPDFFVKHLQFECGMQCAMQYNVWTRNDLCQMDEIHVAPSSWEQLLSLSPSVALYVHLHTRQNQESTAPIVVGCLLTCEWIEMVCRNSEVNAKHRRKDKWYEKRTKKRIKENLTMILSK